MSQPKLTFTRGELARLLGIGVRHVSRLAADGVLPKLARGKYGPEAVRAYCTHLRGEARQGPADFAAERARLTRHRASLAELELGVRRGELIEAEIINEAVISEFARVRAHLLAIPTKYAPRLAKGMEAGEAEGILRDAIHGVLRQLSEPDFGEEDRS